MIRNYLIPLLLSLPFLLPAQINDVELHDMDVQLEDDHVDPATAIKQSIPARLKTGKPELFAYQGRYGYVLNDSILIQPEYQFMEKPYADFMIARNMQNYFGAINKRGEIILPIRETDTGYMVSKKDQRSALHAPDGRRLTPHKYRAIRSCTVSVTPKTLPTNRSIVACATIYTDQGPLFFVLDNAGGEYPDDGR